MDKINYFVPTLLHFISAKQRELVVKNVYFMKKLRLIFSFFILFASCENKTYDESEIVGRYSFSETDDNDDGEMSIEWIQEFNEDNTMVLEGIMKHFLTVEEEDYLNLITLEYQINASGTWKIEGDYLIEKVNPQSVQLKVIGFSAIDEDEVAAYVREAMKQQESYLETTFKKAFAKSGPTKIIRVTDDELVFEGEDGEGDVYVRIDAEPNNPVSKIVPETSDESLSFDDFIKKFISDKDYQLSHIKFPLPDIENPMEDGEVVPTPTKESWDFISSDLFFIGEKEIDGTMFSGEVKKEGLRMIYSLGYVESELVFTLTFGKINGIWMLVEYMEY